MEKIFIIKEDYANSRLDRWLKKVACKIPQSLIEKNLRKGNIKVNNEKKKSSYKLKNNDQVLIKKFYFKPNSIKQSNYKYIPTKGDLSLSSKMIIFSNENFVIINKPSGIAVQAGTKSKKNIIDILKNSKEFEGTMPYPVHRIDKETTGVLIVAKNRKYAQLFTSLFRIRKINKVYLGIIIGELKDQKGKLIDELHYYEGDKKIKVKAITYFEVLNSNNNYSLLKLVPQTGRKHQLRKQLLIHGCPILGDTKYRLTNNFPRKKNNLMLHAHKINFSINDKKYNFSAEPPLIFKNTLKEKYLKTS